MVYFYAKYPSFAYRIQNEPKRQLVTKNFTQWEITWNLFSILIAASEKHNFFLF